MELEVNTEETAGQQGSREATVHLGYLRSYERMALARVECVSGCACQPSLVDGLWEQRVSLQQMHSFAVRARLLRGSGRLCAGACWPPACALATLLQASCAQLSLPHHPALRRPPSTRRAEYA